MTLSGIPKHLRDQVLLRDAGQCRYCHLLQSGQGATFHLDHIHPKSRGGKTSLDNLALQCTNCSLHKSNRISAIDPSTGNEYPLFHPLVNDWNEHFTLHPDGACTGLTPIGRATVTLLQMNNYLPRLARTIQIQLGLLQPSAS